MTAPSTIQYKPGKLAEEIDLRTTRSGSNNLTARTMAERYADMMRNCLPYFAMAEWHLIVSAMDLYMRQECDGDLCSAVRYAITLNNAAEDFGIRCAYDLLKRVNALSFAERMAVVDFGERYGIAVRDGRQALVPGERA